MNYEIIENIATIERPDGKTLELNIIKWFNNPETYDLRLWDGDKPLKGVTMSEDEYESLLSLIEEYDAKQYFSSKEDDEVDDVYDDDESDTEPLEEELDYKTFLIHCNNHYCDHHCRSIIAKVRQYSNGEVKQTSFDAMYCPICEVYYMTEQTFYSIKKTGRIMCQILSVDEYREYEHQKQYDELKPQSILKMIGYTVNSKTDLSEDARHTILKYAIDEGVITKKRAEEYLKFFIRLNRNTPNNKNSVSKWADDLDWLQNLYSKGKRKVGVKKIIE